MGTVSQLGYAAARDLHACMHACMQIKPITRLSVSVLKLLLCHDSTEILYTFTPITHIEYLHAPTRVILLQHTISLHL